MLLRARMTKTEMDRASWSGTVVESGPTEKEKERKGQLEEVDM
jgi:hypothetical protein